MLGANDGIVSTASLIVGVAAANTGHGSVLVAGAAGLVAGAMSMAAGEYVSVSSQADTERADLEIEKRSLEQNEEAEKAELASIYEGRGLEKGLAREVAEQLMAYDALGAHARDEIGISKNGTSKPMQAAGSSALAFSVGAALPLMIASITSGAQLIYSVTASSLLLLAVLGGMAAWVGGASIAVGAFRVIFWGAAAIALTAGVGHMFDLII